MKEKISLYKKRSFEILQKLTKNQKIFSIVGLFVLVVVTTTIVYASPDGHDTPVVEVKQNEQVVVRKVGDTDTDAISQEGLGSFYGEIVSKDVASINPSREGVISSWNVSVGDSVSTGSVLGYITVTGVSSEQQQQIAVAESEAIKAKLDAELAMSIAQDSGDVFSQAQEKYKNLSESQNQAYGKIKNENVVESEINNLARLSFSEIYPLIGIPNQSYSSLGVLFQTGSSIFNDKTYLGIKYGVGVKRTLLDSEYQSYTNGYVKKIRDGNVEIGDLQQFLKKTTEVLTESFPQGDLFTQKNIDDAFALVKDYQEKTADVSTRYREQSLVGVDLQKNLISFETELDLKKLDQKNTQSKAENNAKVALILAQKLAVSAGGVIPILSTKSGVVATVEKNVGDYVTISDRIGFISNANPRKSVRFTIPASWKDINKGDSLSIAWRSEYGMGSAIIAGISPIIDEKGGYQAEAVISKETVFPVGASVRIIPENSKKGVFINRKAVVFEGVTPFVWIVTESNTIRKQEIKVGRGLGEYVEILSGLEREFSYLVILDPLVILENGKSLSEVIKTKSKVEISSPLIQDESKPHEH